MKRILFLVAALSLIAASDDPRKDEPWPPEVPKLKRTQEFSSILFEELIRVQSARMDPKTTQLVGEPSEREKQLHALLVAELTKK